jgi:phenylpyruvate tautomerase PptA (4-oxalocrotonate tautomerase family)
MPIIDVQLVCPEGNPAPPVPAQALADVLGRALGSAPGRTWVRVQTLASSAYAENETLVLGHELPVFVTVLQAHPAQGAALATEVLAVTEAVAACLGRPVERVHVQYAAAAAGRQAFGGRLVE